MTSSKMFSIFLFFLRLVKQRACFLQKYMVD